MYAAVPSNEFSFFFLNVFLHSLCKYFIADHCVSVQHVDWHIISFFVVSFSGLGVKVINTGFIKISLEAFLLFLVYGTT